jgi:hypothetical protein
VFLLVDKNKIVEPIKKDTSDIDQSKLGIFPLVCLRMEEVDLKHEELTELNDIRENITPTKPEPVDYNTREQRELERFVLENAVLFAPPEFSSELPVSFKVIYLTMLKWEALTRNQVFAENLLIAVEWTLQVSDVS